MMELTLTRINKFGQTYILSEVFGPTYMTEVSTNGKSMMMPHHIQLFNQGWYQWMNGEVIQRAFPFLTSGEREFLLTGLTPTEWDEMMKEEED